MGNPYVIDSHFGGSLDPGDSQVLGMPLITPYD